MATGPKRDRGSRKHVLDLLGRGEFETKMGQVLAGTGVRLANPPYPQPAGRTDKSAWRESDAETYLRLAVIKNWAGSLPSDWWVTGRGARPTWDLLCHVLVSEMPGLLLVEAKAHESELDWAGKRLSPSAKLASKANHHRISGCIGQANDALNTLCDGVFNLDVARRYQLVNRIAYAWKLAALGLPVVLLYLGFTGDTYFAADYIRDDAHWQRVMGGYLQGVVPQQFPERVHALVGGGSLQMRVRSSSVAEESKLPGRTGLRPLGGRLDIGEAESISPGSSQQDASPS